MAMQHHNDEEMTRLRERFFQQGRGEAKRSYPNGRIGADDDGELAYAIAADPRNQIIRIDFNKPVTWVGLDRASAEKLIENLTERLMELRGIRPDC